ncbi:uroporphyrin-3 C-methyltransferase/uroporphyrinogen III methyltransferase / synthase [Duganella sp. CF458]|uniref:uroporphyrinogen-III C-methyltransferase n=1 Tax=Duganella sp. CF458 TaxID=1884368 RepID=UPI0008EA745D|nr:uroporphyrinogen-III C-methyltransferase [Duganella sp. CF458]SFF84709.1 uroporphyrin-3 C-methyltransferase/uroporphyrinogen III methyltransferase / synthase [Duganella sp. CF458]
MNDLPNQTDNKDAPPNPQTAPAVETPNAAQTAPASPPVQERDALRQPLTIAVVVLGILLAAQAFYSKNQVFRLREEMARRLQQGDSLNGQTSQLAKTVQETTKEIQLKVGVLENRQQEAQAQQLALEQLYQDMSKNRDEWALAEIEQVLSTASQQLQLAGNVPGALIALQNADRSLSRSDKPQFITIRRAIAKDIERLKALPNVDNVGLAVRLDNVIAQVDGLPMLSDAKPAPPAPAERKAYAPAKAKGKGAAAKDAASAPAEAEEGWGDRLKNVWQDWSSDMWSEVSTLIRVRRVETPDAIMLAPEEAYFLRENLKLRLLNARMALLSRNEAAFRADLLAAQESLARYFDTKTIQTKTAQQLLRQLQGSNLQIEMPTLADSLNAVRNYKAKP